VFFAESLFSEPENIDSWILVWRKNDGREDEPVNIKIKNKEENKGCQPS